MNRPAPRLRLFGLDFDALELSAAVEQMRASARAPLERCRYVVTPNVDHLVLLRRDAALRRAYRHADWVLADGQPLVWASRWLGRPLPGRVAGSDLVPALLASATPQAPLRLFLLGAAPGVAERAAERIAGRWPHAHPVGSYSPTLGFERDPQQNAAIVERVNAASPDVLVIGLGAPKQECWIERHRDQLRVKLAICGGATIDFLAGQRRRAPRWMQRWGGEWLFRLLSEPKRLARRYALDAWVFPQLLWREWARR